MDLLVYCFTAVPAAGTMTGVHTSDHGIHSKHSFSTPTVLNLGFSIAGTMASVLYHEHQTSDQHSF